jgi:hypothetical protein
MPHRDGPAEVTRKWLGIVISIVGLSSGFLSWFSSYVMQGARLNALEAVQSDNRTRIQEAQTAITAIRLETSTHNARSDEQLTHVVETLAEVRGMLQTEAKRPAR